MDPNYPSGYLPQYVNYGTDPYHQHPTAFPNPSGLPPSYPAYPPENYPPLPMYPANVYPTYPTAPSAASGSHAPTPYYQSSSNEPSPHSSPYHSPYAYPAMSHIVRQPSDGFVPPAGGVPSDYSSGSLASHAPSGAYAPSYPPAPSAASSYTIPPLPPRPSSQSAPPPVLPHHPSSGSLGPSVSHLPTPSAQPPPPAIPLRHPSGSLAGPAGDIRPSPPTPTPPLASPSTPSPPIAPRPSSGSLPNPTASSAQPPAHHCSNPQRPASPHAIAANSAAAGPAALKTHTAGFDWSKFAGKGYNHTGVWHQPYTASTSTPSLPWQPVKVEPEVHEQHIIEAARGMPGGLYEDPNFPANAASLGSVGKLPGEVSWKRPREFCEKPQLFIDCTNEGDVVQGSLGDCWFLGALAVVATRIDLMKELLVAEHPEYGFYQFRFYKDGAWRIVTIDDRIPTLNNRPLFASCKDPNELWVPLIEKAFAKLHGSYGAIASGNISEGFVDLTGGTCEDVSFTTTQDQEELWCIIQRSIAEGWLMGCACHANGSAETDASGMGILVNHAYSVISVHDLRATRGTRLVRLRNPWGRREWLGRWSDTSGDWTPELLKKVGYSLGDDGTFMMEWKDFLKYFNKLNICRLYHDSIGHVWHRYMFKGAWKGPQAGGCTNHKTWPMNPQYGLSSKTAKQTTVYISLTQADVRWLGSSRRSQQYYHIGFMLLKTNDNTKKKHKIFQGEVAARSGQFINNREVTAECVLQPNEQYVLLPCTFDPNEEAEFFLVIYSDADIHAHYITEDGQVQASGEVAVHDLNVPMTMLRL